MKKGIFLTLVFGLFVIHIHRPYAAETEKSAELKGIKFHQKGDVSQLELILDKKDINFKKFNVIEDKQIILDLKNVTATPKVIRAFDTSEFSGSIVFISAYKRPSSPNDLRITLQLRDNVRSIIEKGDEGSSLFLNVENRFGVFSKEIVHKSQDTGQPLPQGEVAMGGAGETYHIPKSDSVEDILHNLTLAGRKKYIGKKISFNVHNIRVEDMLRMIADASGFNMIMTESVKTLPPLTLHLTDIPWDQALDTVLSLNKLTAKKNGIILVIRTLGEDAQDKKIELERRAAIELNRPLVTKIFPISYGSISDLNGIIEKYLTKNLGVISLDQRTNSLIVRDTEETMEKIKKIIQALDTQTPQVLIESKIVEVTEIYSKTIGLQQGWGFGYDPIGTLPHAADRVASAVGGREVGLGQNGGPGFSFNSAPVGGNNARNLLNFTITQFGRLTNLDFRLQLMESESKGKVISSPKVITQNKKQASITTQDTKSYTVTTGVGVDAVSSYEQTSAQLQLQVTPQVTNEGSIVMDIVLNKEQFGARPSSDAPPDKQSRNLKTSVLVNNGSTIVLGGIYSFEKSEAHSGIPFLKDVPLIGWLFRTPYAPSKTKNEMIIFLTPRIINQEEAGLVDKSSS